jgi:putative nucleotidyltransferase with HDIG domain
MKILFVDDEPRILEGLERMLFHLSDEWEMEFAQSGQEALELMSHESFDVLVSDMRMPGMDGASLLGKVSVQYPKTVRIVLSGFAELEMTLRAVPVAHQYLTKPCDPEVLEEVVQRACALQNLLSDEKVGALVGKIDRLPSLPLVYSELTQVLAQKGSSADDLARVIDKDMAMSVKILQLVNSAFFGRASTISNVNQAVVRLGFDMLKNLVLAAEIFEPSRVMRSNQSFNMQKLQQHVMACASLAQKMFKDKKKADEAFLAGMLHDIGKLLLVAENPEPYFLAVDLAGEKHIPLYQAEMAVSGVTHSEVGAYLLGIWGLPYPIVEVVANHHVPQRVQHQNFDVLSAVYLANGLINEEEIDLEYLDGLGAADRVEEFRAVLAKNGSF